ncbi:unnamed protein product [Schistosoma curassoni]|uniref:Uncharacterized protein n=1 Tax=Schistosoma curassoni TaxID=6186 RepID=A0A183L5A7_9TREM|nr:unnamed protein product [Schistosoma curassoni]
MYNEHDVNPQTTDPSVDESEGQKFLNKIRIPNYNRKYNDISNSNPTEPEFISQTRRKSPALVMKSGR